VHARVERFVEPALLLALRDSEAHGYGLAEAIEELDPDERVDLGNLYRLLRALEDEGFVASTWRDDRPGRSKRTYRLTDEGRALLDTWAGALRAAQERIGGFLRRHETGPAGEGS
jgi:DNA-binding PadR family transcriptional regulator